MKAGIYQCYDGTLLYIAKDRTIKAFTSCVAHDERTGEVLRGPADLITVTTSDREQRVRFEHNKRMVEANRIDCVPNGCTDFLRALSVAKYSASASEHMRSRDQDEHLVDYIYAATPPGGAKTLLKTDCDHCSAAACGECDPSPVSVIVRPFSDAGMAALKTAMTGELLPSIDAVASVGGQPAACEFKTSVDNPQARHCAQLLSTGESTSQAVKTGDGFEFTGDPARMSSRELKPVPLTVDFETDRMFGPPSTYPVWERTPPQEAFDRNLLLNALKNDPVDVTTQVHSLQTSGNVDCLPLEAQDRRFAVMPFNTAPVLIAHAEDPAAEGNALHARFAQEYLGDPLAAKQAEGRIADSAGSGATGFGMYDIAAAGFVDAANFTVTLPDAVEQWRERLKAALRSAGYRLCHKGSAKKHRQNGKHVVPMFDGTFAWRERTAIEHAAAAQNKDTNRWLRAGGIKTLSVPVGCGKSGVTQRG